MNPLPPGEATELGLQGLSEVVRDERVAEGDTVFLTAKTPREIVFVIPSAARNLTLET